MPWIRIINELPATGKLKEIYEEIKKAWENINHFEGS
jgi:hypothetical protein